MQLFCHLVYLPILYGKKKKTNKKNLKTEPTFWLQKPPKKSDKKKDTMHNKYTKGQNPCLDCFRFIFAYISKNVTTNTFNCSNIHPFFAVWTFFTGSGFNSTVPTHSQKHNTSIHISQQTYYKQQ